MSTDTQELPSSAVLTLPQDFDWLNYDYDFEKFEDVIKFTMCVKNQYEKVLKVTARLLTVVIPAVAQHDPADESMLVCLDASKKKGKVFQTILKQDAAGYLEATKEFLPVHHKVMEMIDDSETLDSGSYLNLCNGTKFSKDSFEKLVPMLYHGRYFNKTFTDTGTGKQMTPYEFMKDNCSWEEVE